MASMSQTIEMKAWKERLAPFKQAIPSRAWWQILNTALPFVAVWLSMAFFAERAYWVSLLLALPAAGFYIRLFIIQHDCGHGAFFRTRRANDITGSIIGAVTLFPYGYWRRTHAVHHATHGNLERREMGDVSTMTVREYLESSWLKRLGYRFYRNPIVLFGIGPAYQFLLKHRLPFDLPWAWKREWASVLRNNLMIAAMLVTAWQLGLLATVLMVHIPIVLIAGSVGVWLFYVQHQFEDTYWEKSENWSFEKAAIDGSSFYDLPPVLRFFTGNIGFHHIHHLSSRIPNYRLLECMQSVPELQRATRLTLRKSFASLKFRLWDESQRKMVGFSHLRTLRSSS